MELELGRNVFDVTTRALVMGDVLPGDTATEIGALVDYRPALVAVHDETQLAAAKAIFDGPIVIRSAAAHVVERCLSQGADLACDPSGFADPNYLRVVEEAGGGVIVCCPSSDADRVAFLTERARWAEAAGIAKTKIIIDTTGTSDADRTTLGAHGYPLMVTTGAEPEAAGLQVLHAMDGVRIIATTEVRSARRTVDTIAEMLERRMANA